MSQGITQGEPLSPQIFNIVVDIIFCHWVGSMAENEARPYGFNYMVALYANDDLIEFTNQVWLK